MAHEGNELVQQLSTAAGILMEDHSPEAISRLPTTSLDVAARLSKLEQAMRHATTLLQATEVLARRNL